MTQRIRFILVAAAFAATPTAAQSQSSAAIWENYDFVPGSKLLFFTDFSEDASATSRAG